MDEQTIQGKLLLFVKENLLVSVLVGVGSICIVVGVITLFTKSSLSDSSLSDQGQPPVVEAAATKAPTEIIVDVEGAVARPGVYHVAASSRMSDVIQASGGFAPDANQEAISQKMNLAAKVIDGSKVYIPRLGEDISPTSGSSAEGEESTGPININTASSQLLDSLPGIGEVTAQKIIDNRPYSSVDDLVQKKVISSNLLAKIKDQITAQEN